MTMTDLLNVVRPTGLVSADSILDAIKLQTESRDMELDYRGSLSKYNKLQTESQDMELDYRGSLSKYNKL
jgi:BTB/POZ domain-containing protein 9